MHLEGYPDQHFDVVERFGRFPHRNAAVGRAPTADEAAWLAGPDVPGWARSQVRAGRPAGRARDTPRTNDDGDVSSSPNGCATMGRSWRLRDVLAGARHSCAARPGLPPWPPQHLWHR